MRKLATKLHEGKKVEAANFLPKVIKKCPKGSYPFPQYPTPHHPNLPIGVICGFFFFSSSPGETYIL
jgi:hypothetical protein